MKRQIDKCEFDEMENWHNCKLTKLQINEMTNR